MSRFLVLLLFPAFCFATFVHDPQRILFIGNSFTYYNGGIDSCLASIYASKGKEVYVERKTTGGQTLEYHFNDQEKIARINNGDWDVVVLQGYSNEPVEPAKRASFFQYAQKLDSVVRAAGAQPYFFLTWAYRDSGSSMAQGLHAAYDSVGRLLGAPVVPVGLSFLRLRQSDDSLFLFSDDKHENDRGTYMASCMFYSFFTGESCVGLPYVKPGVSAEDGAVLQRYAWQTLLDNSYLADKERVVLVNFNGGPQSNAPAPWNNTAQWPVASRVFRCTSDTTGHSTGIAISCGATDVWGGANANGVSTGSNSGVFPDLVMQENWWLEYENKQILTVSGLTPLREYEFSFFGSRRVDTVATNRTTLYAIGTDSVYLDASANSTDTVSIGHVLCDEYGQVRIRIEKAAASVQYGYLAAMVIRCRPIPEPVSIAPLDGQARDRGEAVALGLNHRGLLLRLEENVRLSAALYDAAGRQLLQLAPTHQYPAGRHLISWPAAQCLPNGMYIVRVNLPGRASMQRSFTLVR